MNLYIVYDIANTKEISVKISLASTMLNAIAEPLATATWIVSCTSFICFIFRLTFQVGFELSYILWFCFVMLFHYVKSGVKKFLNVSLVPCLGFSRFIPL